MNKPKLDVMTNINVGFVITGLIGMVEGDGLSPHEAFQMLEVIKNQAFYALNQIKNEH